MISIFSHTLRSIARWLWRYGRTLTCFAVCFVALVPRSSVLVGDRWQAIAYDISPHYFDYIGWELEAISAQIGQSLFGQHAFVDEAARSQFVRDYVDDLAVAQNLEAQVEAIFADPAVAHPEATSAHLQAERDVLRADLRRRQQTAEAILEGQVAAILVEEGFGVMGQLLPPMAMHLSQVPDLLIVSPRESIQLELTFNLQALPIDQLSALEDHIDARYNVSSLVVPLGGIALYPAMVTEEASLPYLVETFAHEWLHHYLYFFPLGLSYFTGDPAQQQARTINETTADLFGKDIARRVLARYYPEFVAQPHALPARTLAQPAFDFAAEMNATRVTVDALLAAGDVAEAEAYMEERREFFYANGFRIRKINQAFFAFYGGYQAGGGVPGTGGADPIGPAIRAIRDLSGSPHAFIRNLRDVTSTAQLLARQQQLEAQHALP